MWGVLEIDWIEKNITGKNNLPLTRLLNLFLQIRLRKGARVRFPNDLLFFKSFVSSLSTHYPSNTPEKEKYPYHLPLRSPQLPKLLSQLRPRREQRRALGRAVHYMHDIPPHSTVFPQHGTDIRA